MFSMKKSVLLSAISPALGADTCFFRGSACARKKEHRPSIASWLQLHFGYGAGAVQPDASRKLKSLEELKPDAVANFQTGEEHKYTYSDITVSSEMEFVSAFIRANQDHLGAKRTADRHDAIPRALEVKRLWKAEGQVEAVDRSKHKSENNASKYFDNTSGKAAVKRFKTSVTELWDKAETHLSKANEALMPQFEVFREKVRGTEKDSTLLFHGTPTMKGIMGFLETGPRTRSESQIHNAGDMFGPGFYLAEAIYKSDEYVIQQEIEKEQLFKFPGIGDVNLGHENYKDLTPFLVFRANYAGVHGFAGQNLSEIESASLTELGKTPRGTGFNLLVDRVEARDTFREYVCYDLETIELAYVVWVKRIYVDADLRAYVNKFPYLQHDPSSCDNKEANSIVFTTGGFECAYPKNRASIADISSYQSDCSLVAAEGPRTCLSVMLTHSSDHFTCSYSDSVLAKLAQVENAKDWGDTEANTALAKLHLERLRNKLFTPLSPSPNLLLLAVRHRDLDLVDHVMKKRKRFSLLPYEYVTGGLLEAARKGYYYKF